jgi:hypothetical protein
MKAFRLAVVATACGVATVAVPTDAKSGDARDHHKRVKPKHRADYRRHRNQVTARFGGRAPGRDILRWGLRPGVPALDRDVVVSDRVLVRMLEASRRPVPSAGIGSPGVAVAAPPRSVGGGGGVPGELQRIARCERHGNYNAVNPSSGAYGKYQIMPKTAASYGCSLATPRGQDACAARIYANGAGRGNWSSCL